MPRSMTGFGAAEATAHGRRWGVEIRTVNGRALKCSCRIPEQLHGIETQLEQQVARHLARGAVTVTVRLHDESERAAAHLNLAALQAYIRELRPVMDSAGLELGAGDLLGLPGVVEEVEDETARNEAMSVLEALIAAACVAVTRMREAEGAALVTDVRGHIDTIASHLETIREGAPDISAAYQARLRQRMDTLLAQVGAQARDEDILREVAIFAERTDIAEEITRLATHLEQFRGLLDQAEGPVGRTLDFLSQEMLREANTMGSKCQDAEMAGHIVQIKGAIDRIKEQVQNIE
ncbi:MAG: YicC family protein [Phycisphaerales bacterium]|nr:YicC family protein [Phycisphaerales bacterium]